MFGVTPWWPQYSMRASACCKIQEILWCAFSFWKWLNVSSHMSSASGYLGFHRTPPRLEPEPLEDMVLFIGLLVQRLLIVEVNSLNICLKKKIKSRPALGVHTHTNDMMENYSNSSKSHTPALGWDFDDLKLSVEQYLHNMRRPGPDPQGGRGPPGGACVQVAGVLIDHLSGLPAGPEAKPRSHTMTPEKGKEKTLRNGVYSFTIAYMDIQGLPSRAVSWPQDLCCRALMTCTELWILLNSQLVAAVVMFCRWQQ